MTGGTEGNKGEKGALNAPETKEEKEVDVQKRIDDALAQAMGLLRESEGVSRKDNIIIALGMLCGLRERKCVGFAGRTMMLVLETAYQV